MESFQDLVLHVKRSRLAMCRMSPIADLTGSYFTKLMLEKEVKAIVYSGLVFFLGGGKCPPQNVEVLSLSE